MTFFNRKEEVIDIELTQYGKHLLSKGRFKPYYYAFFDDDIIYDHKYAGITEVQNDIEGRIKETPRLKTQYIYRGIETEIARNLQDIRTLAVNNDSLDRNLPTLNAIQPTADRHYANSIPLGNAQIGNRKAPTWKVSFLKGELSGSVIIQTGSMQPSLNIPQLNTEIFFETFVKDSSQSIEVLDGEETGLVDGRHGISDAFEDGTFIDLAERSVILEVEEVNGQQLNNEFEIEIFKVENEEVNGELTQREILIPLHFQRSVAKSYEITPDNIYVPKRSSNRSLPAADRTNVEYFLDIDVDAEIDIDTMCEVKPADRTKGLFSSRFYECEDFTQDNERENIYTPDEIFEDPCDD